MYKFTPYKHNIQIWSAIYLKKTSHLEVENDQQIVFELDDLYA